MLPKTGKQYLYKLRNEKLLANICSTDSRSQSPTVPSAYMHLEDVVNGVEHHPMDSLYLMPDENGSFFADSVTRGDDISDDTALPPSSSSPPDFVSSSPRTNSEGSTASKTSVSSTPSAFFSPRVGQYLVSGNKRESPDDLARRLNDRLEHAVIKQESGSVGLYSIVGSSGRRWSSTLEVARDPYLAPSCSMDHGIFSRIGSPNVSKLSNRHLSFEFNSNIYDFKNVTEPNPGSCQIFTNLHGDPQAPDSAQETNISPITFCPNYESSFIDRSVCGEQPFRIIKRAQSYVPLAASDGTEPAWKRPKMHHPVYSHQARRMYAHRNASARRADSLKSTVDRDPPRQFRVELTESKSILKLMIFSQFGGEAPLSMLNTPCLDEAGKPYRSSTRDLKMAVPIVAPPAGHVIGISINSETLAKSRLKRYLERERDLRLADGLPSDTLLCQGRKAVHHALLDSEDSESINMRVWEVALGIGKERRLRVIDWILSVLPSGSEPSKPAESESTQSTPSSSTSSWTVDVDRPVHNLYEQLQTSRETRFHACWMFLRYFYLTMSLDTHLGLRISSGSPSLSRSVSLNSQASTCTEHEGRDLLVWDIAVACLSLSVKLHRDFLYPLLPVYSHEYLALSPHRMSHDDLEFAHRDVLSTLDYRLGSSPQLLLDEFWFGLPSLRNLLNFEGGWEVAMCYAWSFLLGAVREPDVKAFSISLLTTVAIMDGIMKALVHKGQATSETSEQKAILGDEQNHKAEGVLCDIQAFVGLTDVTP